MWEEGKSAIHSDAAHLRAPLPGVTQRRSNARVEWLLTVRMLSQYPPVYLLRTNLRVKHVAAHLVRWGVGVSGEWLAKKWTRRHWKPNLERVRMACLGISLFAFLL